MQVGPARMGLAGARAGALPYPNPDRPLVGRRLTRVTILAGSTVRVWGSLERVLERYQGMLSRSDRTMRVVRADFGADGTLIGAPPRPAAQLLLYSVC